MRFTPCLALAVALVTTGLSSCKKWEQHTEVTDPLLQETLFTEISRRPGLAKFAEYLVKTGLDKELRSSKTFTVWAPADGALQSLDPATVADSARLRQFMANHIAYQTYYSGAQAGTRVLLLNGKKAAVAQNKFDEATITEANLTTGNGVLHIIDRAVPPLPNAWEFINGTTAQYRQSAFIVAQNYFSFDPAQAVIDSISAGTGQPVYRPGTGLVPRNRLLDQGYDLKNEDRLFTLFILEDAAFATETDSLSAFYKTGSTDSTLNLAAMGVLKDAVVEGLYTADQLPGALTSRFGVGIPVNKNAIVATHRLSNGIVYVMSKLDFLTREKIGQVKVQGEQPMGFFRSTGEPVDVRNTTFYRARRNPVTGELFNDIFLYNHTIAGLNIRYRIENLPSARYRVYWTAVNDTLRVSSLINPAAFQQRLALGSRTAANFAYRNVAPNLFSEVYLGDYTHAAFGPLELFLTAANSTAAGTNSLTLDYVRLEPQF